MEPRKSTSPTMAKRAGSLKKMTWPGVWPGQWRTCKVSSPHLNLVALTQPPRGLEGLGRLECEQACLLGERLDPEPIARVRTLDGQSLRRASSPAAPAWSICACVSRIFCSSSLFAATTSNTVSRSPPGSTIAAARVRSHQITEQFCWKGVTGTTWSCIEPPHEVRWRTWPHYGAPGEFPGTLLRAVTRSERPKSH